jgi:hypothetical protein
MNQILKSMTQEDFEAAVQAKVETLLSSREDAQARAEAEEALTEAKETFEVLKTSLEAKDVKITEYEEALANLDVSSPTEGEVAANNRLVELETALEEARTHAVVAQAALDTIAGEETAASRMAELDEADVTLDAEDAETQYAKIRDMSDEEFQAYKSELVALKAKFTVTDSEESEEDKGLDLANLDDSEVKEIAERLGCDPEDAKCVDLVQKVVAKVAEVSQTRTASSSEETNDTGKEESQTEETASDETPNKETASEKKLSTGEAIAKAINQEIRANLSMKQEMTQAWEDLYASRRGEKNSE